MDELIKRLKPGPQNDPRWPAIGRSRRVQRTEAEPIRWEGEADVSQSRYNRALPEGGDFEIAWNLVDTANVVITDRRMAYSAHTLKKSAPGVLTGVRAVLGKTDRSRWDSVQAGHMRFDWPVNVMLMTQRTMWTNIASLGVTCLGESDVPQRILLVFEFGSKNSAVADPTRLADALATAIARYRIAARGDELDAAALGALTQVTPVVTASGGLRWDLPGALRYPGVTAGPDSVTAVPEDPAHPMPSSTGKPHGWAGGAWSRLWNGVAMVAATALVLFALGSLPSFGASAHAVSLRDAARTASATGDPRGAARAWISVLNAAPRSVEALVRLSCLDWDIGYQDEAVVYYQRALNDGAVWDRVIIEESCFLNAPLLHNLSIVEFIAGFPLLYANPDGGDADGAVLRAVATASPTEGTRAAYLSAIAPQTEPTDWQRLLALACLNDRAGLRLLAAVALTGGLNGVTAPLATDGLLRSCLIDLGPRYSFITKNGVEIFRPKDLGTRTFIPENSPVPATLPRALP
jgi:hypothetical protein